MKNVFRWLKATLLSAALAGFAHSQQTTNESQPTQASATQSSTSADATAPKGASAVDPAQLAERDRLIEQVNKLDAEGKLADAIATCEEVLALERSLFGSNHEQLIGTLNALASLQEDAGDFDSARRALQEVVKIKTKKLGLDHWQVSNARRDLSELDLRSKLTPDQQRRLEEADRAHQMSIEFYQQGKLAEAIHWAAKALELCKEILGENYSNSVMGLSNLAQLYEHQGAHARALPLWEEALVINKKVLGENHPDTATSVNNLAGLYRSQRDYLRAMPLYEQALAIRKRALGEHHPDTAESLDNLAFLHYSQGDYAGALPLYEQALAIRNRALGENHPDTAASLNNLAVLYEHQGDYTRALPLYEKALAINTRARGANHPDTANSLNNLAVLYEHQGDYARALLLLEQALAINRKVRGENHPDTASSLHNLAGLYHSQRDYARALPLLEQALEIRKQALSENHTDTATSLNNLAELYRSQGDYARALPLCEQALAIQRVVLGENHPHTAKTLSNLGNIYQAQGDYAQALRLCKQALVIHEQILGEDHPDTAKGLNNLAELYRSQSDYVRALPLFQQAGDIIISHLDATAAVQSERQQLAQSNESKIYISNFVSCSLLAGRFEKIAYQQVMARKGAVLRRQRQLQMARAADEPNEQRLWTDVQSVATRLATISFSAPPPDQAAGWRRQLADLTEQKERLEAELSQRSAEFRQLQARARLTPDQFRATLPPEIALADLMEFSRNVVEKQPDLPPKRYAERRFAAFILRADSHVVAVDLGLAEPIDAAVAAWREQQSQPNTNFEDTGQQLRRLVWEPLIPHLEGTTTVLVSPDGSLASIPWGALPGNKPGTYLLEERAIAVVPVPHLIPDILRETKDVAAPSLFVVGDVDYGAAPGQPELVAQSRSAPRGEVERDDLRGRWSTLTATQPEITDIEASFREAFSPADVTRLQAGAATEEAFRQQAGKHRFLHLATHGFFAPPEIRSALAPDKIREGALGQSDLFGERGVVGFHPGLLSGIVLAGANMPADADRDDGILTALEVGALDLRNVDMVTLSACETGLGEVAGGEGILGLQRAFQIAGARTTVASLWKVNDDATRALMSEFYKNLWERKLPRVEALRQAQLAMLNRYDPKSRTLRGPGGVVDVEPEELVESQDESSKRAASRTPPAYWAAFVLSGDWR